MWDYRALFLYGLICRLTKQEQAAIGLLLVEIIDLERMKPREQSQGFTGYLRTISRRSQRMPNSDSL